MEFEKACSEVDYILDNLDAEYKKNIPNEMVNFFKFNKDIFYKVNLDMSKPLDEQNLMEETKAFLYILKEDYFGMEEEQTEVIKFEKESEEKILEITDKGDTSESSVGKEMVVYSKNPIINLFRKILDLLKRH